MNKKELLSNISKKIKGDEAVVEDIFNLNSELSSRYNKENSIYLIIYTIIFVVSFFTKDKIDNLAFVSIDNFLYLILAFFAVAFIGLIINIIYKDRDSLKSLKFNYLKYHILDILNFVGVFLSVFLWLALFIVTPVEVSGSSMEATFYEGDKIMVWHIGYEATVNDVVIIEANSNYMFDDNTEFVIKRVVANSGDKVTFFDGIIGVNGKTINRTYINAYGETCVEQFTLPQFEMMMTDYVADGENVKHYSYNEQEERYEGTVPEGYCIVLGDNIHNSMDSKSVGLIHKEDVIGKVFLRIYPFNKIGIF